MAQTPPPADPSSLVELLTKGILLTTDRIQATLDDAVQRGRMTRDDAEELARTLVESGRRQTEELLSDLESLVGRSLGAAGGTVRRVAGRSSFPIAGYDHLTADQVVARLDGLSAAQLTSVRDHERAHRNRKTVLRAIERALAS
jgi:hypothetical protein